MLVSISEGFCLDGLLGAILFREGDDMLADVERCRGGGVPVVVHVDFHFDEQSGSSLPINASRIMTSAKRSDLDSGSPNGPNRGYNGGTQVCIYVLRIGCMY
jgi:hypothetical protein